MDDEEVQALIAEFQKLRIRAATIVRQLEAVNARRTSIDSIAAPVVHESHLTANGFRKGDRVRIKNKVSKPATWPIEKPWRREEAQLAMISRVTKKQVHFLTDNVVSTWRAPNNLQRIE
jgi:hypothetical protein